MTEEKEKIKNGGVTFACVAVNFQPPSGFTVCLFSVRRVNLTSYTVKKFWFLHKQQFSSNCLSVKFARYTGLFALQRCRLIKDKYTRTHTHTLLGL